MAVTYLFAGIPVAHRDAAAGWYERLVGRPPDLVPNDDEAAWRLTETGWIYIVVDADRAGSALHTLLVDDLDAFLAGLAERGITDQSSRNHWRCRASFGRHRPGRQSPSGRSAADMNGSVASRPTRAARAGRTHTRQVGYSAIWSGPYANWPPSRRMHSDGRSRRTAGLISLACTTNSTIVLAHGISEQLMKPVT